MEVLLLSFGGYFVLRRILHTSEMKQKLKRQIRDGTVKEVEGIGTQLFTADMSSSRWVKEAVVGDFEFNGINGADEEKVDFQLIPWNGYNWSKQPPTFEKKWNFY